MKESMAIRVGRIISGGFNALIDAVENAAPEAVMAQAIREVDGAIEEVRAELGKVIANRHLTSRKLEQERSHHAELANQIALAIKESREELAEAGIARQLDIEAQLPVLEKSLGELTAREKELEGYIEALKAKQREMQAELKEFRAVQAGAKANSGESAAPAGGEVDRATNAFRRVMERNGGATGSSTNPADAVKLAELEELSRKNRIKERLAAIKAGTDQ